MIAGAGQPLFSYGTLALERVQRARFGRAIKGRPDVIAGWRLETVCIADPQVLAQSGVAEHPVLVRSSDPADRVAGVVLMLTEAELAAADAYEVSDYARISVPLASGSQAWAYARAGS